jgi:hypothetical protein
MSDAMSPLAPTHSSQSGAKTIPEDEGELMILERQCKAMIGGEESSVPEQSCDREKLHSFAGMTPNTAEVCRNKCGNAGGKDC